MSLKQFMETECLTVCFHMSKKGMELQVGWVEMECGWRRSHPTPCIGNELRKSRSEKDVQLTLNQGSRWKAGVVTLGSVLNQMNWPSS